MLKKRRIGAEAETYRRDSLMLIISSSNSKTANRLLRQSILMSTILAVASIRRELLLHINL